MASQFVQFLNKREKEQTVDLVGFREMFRKLSGRFDLVNADFSDNGLDYFIEPGIKYLDRLDETQKSWATRFATLSIGGISATFPYCRAIKEVWAASPTEGRWQLEKQNLQNLMDEYLMTLPDEMETGTPSYYSPCVTRSVPLGDTLASFQEFMGYVEVTDYDYNAILVNVPTDEEISLIIHGLFYSPGLAADTDTNYWSQVHPMLLYMSTMRQVEIINRNTQGVNDWTGAISSEARQLGFDLIEELIAEVDQIEG